ncbi:MAG: hypothetical protein AAF602_29945 [Myxococcota bacterium]
MLALVVAAPALAAERPSVDAVEIEVGDLSTAVVPFSNLAPLGPLRPVVTVGAQYVWVDQRFDIVQTLRVGGHAHPTAGNAARLGTDLDLRWTSGVGPLVEAGLSFGVNHVFRARPVLVFDPDTQEYTERASRGRLGVAGGVGLALGVDLSDLSKVPVTLLVDYHWGVQTAWLPALPVGPFGALSAGVRFALGGDR